MSFIGKRLGLILWVAVALAIALIPQWRARAGRQWESATENFKARFTPVETVEAVVANSALPPLTAPDEIPEDQLSMPWEREAARRFPDDPLAQIAPLHRPGVNQQMASDKPRVNETIARYFARYDALERRFPDSNAVRAQRLRDATRGGIPVTTDLGPQPDAPDQKLDAPPVFPAQRAQLEAALKTARAGARLERDNAFFPWMEAVFEFALRRDAAAIAALGRAGRCARFDDYLMANVRGRLNLLHRLRATGWEDDADEMFGALLPHLARMYYASTAIMDRARVARKNGDQARALELVGILQRAGAALARANDLYMTRRVGENVVVRAWQFALEDQANLPVEPKDNAFFPSPANTVALSTYQRQMAERFETYARAQGRSDLARQARDIAARFDAHNAIALYHSGTVPNLVQSVARLARRSWWASVALFLGAVAGAVWLLAWPFSRRAQDASARRGALQSAMFVTGVTIITLASLSILVPNVANSPYSWDDSKAPPTGALLWLSEYYLLFILALWLISSVGALVWRGAKLGFGALTRLAPRRTWGLSWRRAFAILIGLGFSVGLLVFVLGQTGSPDSISAQLAPLSGAIFGVCALAGSLMLVGLRGRNRAPIALMVGAFWFSAAVPPLYERGGDAPFYASIALALALTLSGLALLAAARGCKFSFDWLGEIAFQLAARTRIAAGVLALLCALAYLGIALWTIPVEHRARAQMQRQLQIGEVAWLREQL